MSQTAFVIINWNNPDITVRAVRSVIEYENTSGIIVIDNNSSNYLKRKLIESLKDLSFNILEFTHHYHNHMMKDFHENISPRRYLVLLKKNLGYGAAANIGIRFSNFLGYKFSILMNNDVILISPVVRELENFVKDKSDIAVIGVRILNEKGRVQIQYNVFKKGIFYELFQGICFPITYLIEKLYNSWLNSQTRGSYVYSVSGAFMFIKNKVFIEIGGFDEQVFLFSEEIILSEKLREKGYRMFYYPKIAIFHIHSATIDSNIDYEKRFHMQLSSVMYYYSKYRKYGKIRLTFIKNFRKLNYLWRKFIKTAKLYIKSWEEKL